MAYQILTTTAASITDLKKNPMGTVADGDGEASRLDDRRVALNVVEPGVGDRLRGVVAVACRQYRVRLDGQVPSRVMLRCRWPQAGCPCKVNRCHLQCAVRQTGGHPPFRRPDPHGATA